MHNLSSSFFFLRLNFVFYYFLGMNENVILQQHIRCYNKWLVTLKFNCSLLRYETNALAFVSTTY